MQLLNRVIRFIYKKIMLFIFKFFQIKLNFYKKHNNIKFPIIHVYTVCWNEEKFLPFFLKHYDFADKIIVYDNESTDNSLNILAQNSKVEIVSYSTNNQINDLKYIEIKNNCWKQSRGKADYVIVCDVDELLYCIDLKTSILDFLSKSNNTIFKPISYEMVCEKFPNFEKPLIEQCKGCKSSYYNKKILFNPHKIVEINYYPGCHEANPIGEIKLGEGQFQLLHYKNMGLEFVLDRYHIYKSRLSQVNIKKQMGTTYLKKDEEIIQGFNYFLNNAKSLI